MYPVLAISQGQVPTGILPGCGDDCYPPCLQTRVSYYASKVLKEEHRRSVAGQGVPESELVKVLLLGAHTVLSLSWKIPRALGHSFWPRTLWMPLPFQGLG